MKRNLTKVWSINIKNYKTVCRGFGFVTYADPSNMDKVIADGPHNIDGKKV